MRYIAKSEIRKRSGLVIGDTAERIDHLEKKHFSIRSILGRALRRFTFHIWK